MNFLKKLTGGKSATDMAQKACKEMGLEPKMLIQQIFTKFCGSSKDKEGNPSMNLGSLMQLLNFSKILTKGKKVGEDTVKNIFDKRKGEDGNMNFDQFYDGCRDIADEKYKDDKKCKTSDDRLKKLESQIITDSQGFDDWTGAD